MSDFKEKLLIALLINHIALLVRLIALLISLIALLEHSIALVLTAIARLVSFIALLMSVIALLVSLIALLKHTIACPLTSIARIVSRIAPLISVIALLLRLIALLVHYKALPSVSKAEGKATILATEQTTAFPQFKNRLQKCGKFIVKIPYPKRVEMIYSPAQTTGNDYTAKRLFNHSSSLINYQLRNGRRNHSTNTTRE